MVTTVTDWGTALVTSITAALAVVVGAIPRIIGFLITVIRLCVALFAEQTEEWLVGHRYSILASLGAIVQPPAPELPGAEVAVA